jgi:predicted RNase H-like HicB family nuclease
MKENKYGDSNGDSMTMRYRVVLEPGKDGWIVATVPAVKGCISQGRTREEALTNIKDALLGILEARKEKGWPIPEETEVEVNA